MSLSEVLAIRSVPEFGASAAMQLLAELMLVPSVCVLCFCSQLLYEPPEDRCHYLHASMHVLVNTAASSSMTPGPRFLAGSCTYANARCVA